MINLNKRIKIKVTGYESQIRWKADKCYNASFYLTKIYLRNIYKNRYIGTGYLGCMNLFKVVAKKDNTNDRYNETSRNDGTITPTTIPEWHRYIQ